MSFSSKMAFKYIKAQKKHSVFIILSIAAALMLVTFIFTLFSSFYSTMLYNERQKFWYHAIIHDTLRTDAERLTQSDMITRYEFAPYSSDGEKGVLYISFRNDIYDPETFIREFSEESFENKEYSLSLSETLLEYEVIGIHAKASLAKKLVIVCAVVLFILFCARFVIDTAFEISSKEKEVQFGILASLGASKSQITAIIMWQGAFLSVIGIPLGLLLGTGIGYLVFCYAESVGAIAFFTGSEMYCTGVFSVSALYLVIATVIGLAWVTLSAYGTGKRYSAKSPIDSVRQSNKKMIKKKKSRPSKNVSGQAAKLALKNIRRDKKSFIVTSLALAISFTMISLFSVFLDYWNAEMTYVKKNGMLSENIADDYQLYYILDNDPDNNDKEMEECYRILENCPEDIYFCNTQRCNVIVTKDSYVLKEKLPFDKDYRNYIDSVGEGMSLQFYFLSRQYYDDIFAEETGISYDELTEKNGFIVCETGAPLAERIDGEVVTFEGSPLVAGGDSLELNLYDIYGGIVSINTEVNLLGTARGVRRFSSHTYWVTLVGTEDCLKSLNGGSIINSERLVEFMVGLPRDNNKTLGQMNEEFRNYLKDYPQFELAGSEYNGGMDSIISTERKMMPVLSVIVAVVAVVTLIAVIHLINIISTGIMNRRKEIASLTSIGMTRWQLFRMLLLEGMGYTLSGGVAALIISVIATFLANSYIISQNWDVLLLFSYPCAIVIPLLSALGGFIISAVTIFVSLKLFDRVSVAEEMKTIE